MSKRVSAMNDNFRFSSRSAMAPLQNTKRKRFSGAVGSTLCAQARANAALYSHWTRRAVSRSGKSVLFPPTVL